MKYNKILTIGSQKYKVYMTWDEKEIEKGLMYITELESDGGMLLSYEKPDNYGIWMKNVCIPLDIIWIDEENTIIENKTLQMNVEEPESTITYIDKKSKYILEVNAGSFKGKIGDKVTFDGVGE
mgnify:CR=1 FL=1